MDGIKSLKHESFTEFTERKSIFYGSAKPIFSETEALDFISEVRKKYSDATHNVYAYTVKENGVQTVRFSDDGEPHGTAGLPVLDVLRKEGVNNAVIVVTRYFGGILLGAGGLVRAYTASAKSALDAAETVMWLPYTAFTVKTSYSDHGKAEYILKTADVVVNDTVFDESVTIFGALPSERIEQLKEKLTETTGGRAEFTVTGEVLTPVS